MKFQQGSILPLTLIILLVLMTLAATAIKSGLFAQKIVVNQQDKNQSFQAAEVALRDAEIWLSNQIAAPIPVSQCTTVPCILSNNPTRYPETQPTSWWQSNAAAATTSLNQVSSAPRFSIEFNRFVPDDSTIGLGYNQQGSYFYRVTAKGFGYSGEAQTAIQTHIGRRY